MTVLIATPSLLPNDAVSNDVLQLRAFLVETGETVLLFAEFCHDSLRNLTVKYSDFVLDLKREENTLIYHHSVYWEIGEDLVRLAKCRVFMKYHNITPSKFFSYDPLRSSITAQGREQTRRFIQNSKFQLYISDSRFNSEELLACGAPAEASHIIAPFHRVHDFDRIPVNEGLKKKLEQDGRKHVLFVGRVAPNKGHKHLIQTLSRYVDFYGANICLHVIGGILAGDGPYLREIEDLIEKLSLADLVQFHDKLSFQDMHTFYDSCDAFLVMSEHEGFCVPILEAQYHRLPVVAWDHCAVGETTGREQLVMRDLDYDAFAVALYKVMHDKNLQERLISAGESNFQRFEAPLLLKKTRELLYG